MQVYIAGHQRKGTPFLHIPSVTLQGHLLGLLKIAKRDPIIWGEMWYRLPKPWSAWWLACKFGYSYIYFDLLGDPLAYLPWVLLPSSSLLLCAHAPSFYPITAQMTVVFGRLSCWAMALMDSWSFFAFVLLASQSSSALSMSDSFHVWFLLPSWDMASFFCSGVYRTLPPLPFFENFSFAIVLWRKESPKIVTRLVTHLVDLVWLVGGVTRLILFPLALIKCAYI